MEEDFDNIPTGVKNDANTHGVIEGQSPEPEENQAGEQTRGDQRRDTNISKPSEAKNSSRRDSEGIIEGKLHKPSHKEAGPLGDATDSHPTLMPVHSGSKPRFVTDPSAANLQVKTPTNDNRTAALGYNPFKQGSHTVLNGLGNQKPSASNMALSFGAEKLTPTLNSPVQRSSDKLPEAKALMVPVPPYRDLEEGHHPSGGRASSAIKKKVPTLSESRFKKKSHLKMMAEVVEFAAMAPEGGGKAIQSDQQYKNKKYAHTHGHNTQSRQSSANPDVRNKPELFLKRPRGEEQRARKIDHEAIRNHANSFMVHQLESDIAREQRRKQFLEEWRKNELHANKSRSQEIASSYRKLYREHLEKSLEYKANAAIGKSMNPDAVRERLANRDKYAEMIRHITKSSPRPANQGDTSNNSMSKVEKSGPARTIFEAIERQRKRSQDSNKNRQLVGNEYMKFAITKARQDKSLNKSVDQKQKEENLQEYAPVRLASAKRQKFAYSIHDIFQSKEPLGLESTHYARLESIRKADNFKSAHSKAVAAGAIKSIDQELAKKEKLGQSGDQLDQDYLRSIHTKLEVLGVGHGTIPKKYTPLGFKPATQRLQSAVVNRAQAGLSLGAKPTTSASPKKPVPSSARLKSQEANDSRPAHHNPPQQSPQKPLKNQPAGDSTQQLQVLQPNNTRKQLSSMSPNQKADASPPPAKDQGLASKKQSQQVLAGNTQSKNLTSLGRLPPNQTSMAQLSAAGIDGKEMLPEAVLADPLIKGLSRDLDADPSESMRASHQAKLKRELGDFFERQQTGSLADEARRVRESQKALDEF